MVFLVIQALVLGDNLFPNSTATVDTEENTLCENCNMGTGDNSTWTCLFIDFKAISMA